MRWVFGGVVSFGVLTCRVEGGITYKQEYNYENRLSAVKKMNGTCTGGTVLETTSFVYDGDGKLVKKTKPDGSKTIHVGSLYEVDKNSGGTVTRTVTYYPVAGAMRININGGSNTLYYILKDHLGSASVVTDASGNPIIGGEQRYPYGETRLTATMLTDKLLTGQRVRRVRYNFLDEKHLAATAIPSIPLCAHLPGSSGKSQPGRADFPGRRAGLVSLP